MAFIGNEDFIQKLSSSLKSPLGIWNRCEENLSKSIHQHLGNDLIHISHKTDRPLNLHRRFIRMNKANKMFHSKSYPGRLSHRTHWRLSKGPPWYPSNYLWKKPLKTYHDPVPCSFEIHWTPKTLFDRVYFKVIASSPYPCEVVINLWLHQNVFLTRSVCSLLIESLFIRWVTSWKFFLESVWVRTNSAAKIGISSWVVFNLESNLGCYSSVFKLQWM